MRTNFADFQKEVDELDEYIKSYYKKYETDNRELISDGLVNVLEYYKSENKIMWILKEPYDEGDNTGGGWSLTGEIDRIPEQFVLHSSKGTWQPIVYVSYALQNNKANYSDMYWISNDHNMMNALKKIAYINVQKMPAEKTTNYTNIDNAYKKHKDILLKQIVVYAPNIIIGAGTLNLFLNDLGLENEGYKTESGSIEYWIKDSKIYIWAYHPGQHAKTWSVYINDILSAVKQLKDNK